MEVPIQRQVFLVCKSSSLRYSEDYCDALIVALNWKYLKYSNPADICIDDTNIYIFRLIIPDHIVAMKHLYPNFYVLNTEQLTKKIWFDRIKNYADMGIGIITYNKYHSFDLPYKPLYLPYPIVEPESEVLADLVRKTPKPYDVAFCSVNSVYRKVIFDELKDRGVKVLNVMGWKLSRDQLIASAKILINIHYDDTYNIYEHIRCDRWILAGQIVVSEPSLADEFLDINSLIIICKYTELVDTIVKILANYEYYYDKFTKELDHIKLDIIQQRLDQCREVNSLIQQCPSSPSL